MIFVRKSDNIVTSSYNECEQFEVMIFELSYNVVQPFSRPDTNSKKVKKIQLVKTEYNLLTEASSPTTKSRTRISGA